LIAVLSAAVAALAAAFAGSGLVPPPASRDLDVRFDWLCFAATAGAALTVAVAVAAGLSGLPVFGGASLGIAAAIGILGRWLLPRRAWTLPSSPHERRWPVAISRAVLVAALVIFAWKVHRVPVWSWDHHSVWGMKARHLAEGGFLNLSFLRVAPFRYTNPDYPIGLPVLWRILTLGREPAWPDFKVCHVLFGVATIGLFRLALRTGGASASFANATAAFVAASPLYWDTESLGLAEMPLAAAMLAAVVLLLRRREDPRERPPAWLLGFLLGFLSWIKQEGLSLAILLFAAAWVMSRRGARAAGAVFVVTAGAALALGGGSPSGPFLSGDWPHRFLQRLPHAEAVLGNMVTELAASDWIGFWPAFVLAAGWAIWRRDRCAVVLSAVVAGQTALYLFVYLGTYLDPAAHIRSSFFRLMSALLPLAAVAVGLLAAPLEASTTEAFGEEDERKAASRGADT
jgi:hypothetical protein